ncbi:multicopper oxidase-domain-containing protein [Paraphoma chrysanthemicola]|nr:multicopper oxidase-domain-containing protein [Paraphoma chrysanthemicola]
MRHIKPVLALMLAASTLAIAKVAPLRRSDVSIDGHCGVGITCKGSQFGGCCRADGKCGSTPDYCGQSCQIAFGHCDNTQGRTSPDGTCGGAKGYTCTGSSFGSCCSIYEYCGDGSAFCSPKKCQSPFGNCDSSFKEHKTPIVRSEPSSATSTTLAPATTTPLYTSIKGPVPSQADRSRLAVRAPVRGLACPEANGTIYKTDCGAEFKVECGLDHSGGDIWWPGNGFITESLRSCVEECTRWPTCVDVSWVNQYRPGGPCYIKEKVGDVIYHAEVAGAKQVKACKKGSYPTATPDLNIPPYTTLSSSKSAVSSPPVLGSDHASSGSTSPTTKSSSQESVTKIITPTLIASSANPTLSSFVSASASASACVNPVPRRASRNAAFKREEVDKDCVPCQGQGGSLPYCGADHTFDNYKFTPKTCRTVYYNLDITNTTLSPDGAESRIALAVNGQMPGPLLEASWGDTVVVTVNNKLRDNGTSIHFHGIRQLNNSEHDGVPAITQCPIAPGDSFTYKWTATNYGTSWYHSHYAIQAWEGVFGPMIIHGPTSASYDVDAGTIILQDWSHRTVDSLYDQRQDAAGGPLEMQNGLINGMNTWGVQGTKNQTGQRFELTTKFEPGKTYLLRIINAAIQSTFKFYIDDHELEVINMDFTNIVPYKTNIVNLQIGQRYNVLVKANRKPGDYWMRADNQEACSANTQSLDIKGIIRYARAASTTSVPTSTAYNYTGECVDEPLASLVPTAKLNAFPSDTSISKDVAAIVKDNLFKWYLSGTTFFSRWEDPTLVRIIANNTAPTYSGNLILDLPKMGEWVYIIVQSSIPVNHPIHLHGHDFLILGTGPGVYTDQPLNLVNPPRRDTANMPAAGYLVIAFETDNPGAWLMHCHIGWHTSMGFALQIVEGQSMIRDTVKDECALYGTCANWNMWVEARGHKQHDSGV